MPQAEKSQFTFGTVRSTGKNINVTNNGHTVVVNFPATGYKTSASVAVKGDKRKATLTSQLKSANGTVTRVPLNPAQFHFHAYSEHSLGGKQEAPHMLSGSCLALLAALL